MLWPQCFVLADKRIISPISVQPLKAILAVFMCYFVFKIPYPKDLYPLLNLLERDIVLIKVEGESTRIERDKNAKGVWLGSTSALAPTYVTLKRQIQDDLGVIEISGSRHLLVIKECINVFS